MSSKNYAISTWEYLVDILKKENIITPISFDNWFSNIMPLELTNDSLLIQVEDEFSLNWINDNFKGEIEKKLKKILSKKIEIKLITKKENNYINTQINVNHTEEKAKIVNQTKNDDKKIKINNNINPKLTFDNFVSGTSNQLAYNLAISIAENPGNSRYNPLFLYGKSGVGKTHLLQAIGNHILKNSDKIPLYVTSEAFLTEYVKSIRNQTTLNFRDKYRKIDLLIVDDIQFFAGKEGIQEEFFHTFNHLHQLNKQIIISSDCKPNELSTLTERLRSRFSWGILTDIKTPELETRIAILQSKILSLNMNEMINNDVIEYLATNITTNVRDLEGSLNSLLANAIMYERKEIDLDLAVKTLGSYIEEVGYKKISITNIQKQTAKYFHINYECLKSKSRKEPLSTYRHICIYLCKYLTNESLKKIGLEFGKRDHSTVINSIKKVEKLLKDDINIKKAIDEIINKFPNVNNL